MYSLNILQFFNYSRQLSPPPPPPRKTFILRKQKKKKITKSIRYRFYWRARFERRLHASNWRRRGKLDGGTSREERVRRPTPSASACNRRVQTSAIENWIMARLQPRNKRNLVLDRLSYSDLLPSSFPIFPFLASGENDHPSDVVHDFATIWCLSGYSPRFNLGERKVNREFREIRWPHATGRILPTIFNFFLYSLNNSNKLLTRRIFTSLHNFINLNLQIKNQSILPVRSFRIILKSISNKFETFESFDTLLSTWLKNKNNN